MLLEKCMSFFFPLLYPRVRNIIYDGQTSTQSQIALNATDTSFALGCCFSEDLAFAADLVLGARSFGLVVKPSTYALVSTPSSQ
jgi:hypothetical protein